jgi:hypothetical protein
LNSIYDKLNSKQSKRKEKLLCSKIVISTVSSILSTNNTLLGGFPNENADNNIKEITLTLPFTTSNIKVPSTRQLLIAFVLVFLIHIIAVFSIESCIADPFNTAFRQSFVSILTSGEQLHLKEESYTKVVRRNVNKDIDRINEAISASTNMYSMIDYSRKYGLHFHTELDKYNITESDTVKKSVEKYYNQTLFYFNNYFPSHSWGKIMVADALRNACSNKVQRHTFTTANTVHSWNWNYFFTVIGHISNKNVMKRMTGELGTTIAHMSANVKNMENALSDANATYEGMKYYYSIKNWIMFSAFCYVLNLHKIIKQNKNVTNKINSSTITLTESDTGIELEQIDYKDGGKSKRKTKTKKKQTKKKRYKSKQKTKKVFRI